MSLITENNKQYYAGSQSFIVPGDGPSQSFTTTFDTDLVFGDALSYDSSQTNYALNNFKLYTASPGDITYTEYILPYVVVGNTITIEEDLNQGLSIVVQLKTEAGGNYGDRDAYGSTVQENWGSYAYIKLDDIINNFTVAYVGDGKLIPSVNRTDLMFFAKRAMQEFSYDTLKSIKSQELNIPPSLSIAMPQDYVNYVKMSWVDNSGVKHIIYPTTLTSNPYRNPIQDSSGIPMQDNFGNNTQGTSITDERWSGNRIAAANKNAGDTDFFLNGGNSNVNNGGLYGLNPATAQINGWFTINERKNTFSFSNDLVGRLIILEYISDGLAYDLDTKVPKMAEEALYAYMSHAVVSTKAGQPEYVVNRLSREKVAKLRNAKIRLSNIKLEEISQVMRGKSKWIKS
tara:strand:+ start:773 stop:1975 length:1203 start_codon:yes stop_codon:yes gene_type:complete